MASANEPTENVVFLKSAAILDTSLTYDWLERTLQECFKTCATLEDCKATRIGVGHGFLSYIIHLELKWLQEEKQPQNDLPSDLVLKVPTTATCKKDFAKTFKDDDESVKKMMDNIDVEVLIKKAHRCECEIYRLFSGMHEELRVPKCYHLTDITDTAPGVIIMDYLGDRGVPRTLINTLNLEGLFQVADELATLHAWCFKNRSLWEGNANLWSAFALMMMADSEEKADENIQRTIDMLKEMCPEKFDPLAERIRELGITAADVKRYSSVHEQFNIPPVLVHGDLHIGNVMFYKDDDTEMAGEILSIIDWQTVHTGCAVEDFARLLTSSVATDVRRAHTDVVLKRYYDTLIVKLDGQDSGFSYETLKQAYREFFKFATVKIIMAFPFFAKQTQLLGDDPEAKAEELMERAHGILVDAVAILEDN